MEYVETLEAAETLEASKIQPLLPPIIPDGSISIEGLAAMARLPVETVLAQLEKKGLVSAGSKNWVRSAENPDRFVVQPKAKRKDNNAG